MSGNNPFLDHSQKLAIDLDVPNAHVLFEGIYIPTYMKTRYANIHCRINKQISDRLTH
jgi:hypothetical protein